ncbi:MAG: 4Fe-4S binding protein, partial [Clostridium sp.]|nr:4Fe-4S binding protein [Clostridium sp.]
MSNLKITNDFKRSKKSVLKTILKCIPMMILSGLMMLGENSSGEVISLIATIITYIFINVMFFLMLYTNKIDKYRSIIFVIGAVFFTIGFMANLWEARGSLAVDKADMIQGFTPFCHIVIPMTIIPAIITKTIIFPGSLNNWIYSISSMFVIWITASLVLGRGWCSWACFYGGWDDGFSRIRKKPVIKNINKKWTYLSFAVLLAVVLTSAASLDATYCTWLCPFKAVSESVAIDSPLAAFQTVIFIVLFLVLVIILPLLTKKRTQCALFCPFGAFQSFTNKINIFDVRIDTEKCKKCKKCVNVCPVYCIDEKSLETGKVNFTCTKC